MDHLSLPHRRPGFTLLEIMIAIGIIVVLAGILMVAGSGVMKNTRENATKVSLASVQGMFAELDAKTRLAKPPAAWLWRDATGVKTMVASGNIDFWKVPGMKGPDIDSLDAPGVVLDSSPETRNGSKAIVNTQIVMNYLMAMPSNRDALQKLRAEQYMIPEWHGGKTIPAGSTDGVLYTGDDGTESIAYVTGSRVQYNNERFLCSKVLANGDAPISSSTSNTAEWAPDKGQAVPIMLDAWDNPIIFVPGSGLRVRLLNGKPENVSADVDQTFIIVSPEGKVRDNGSDGTPGNPPVVTQPGRPFFASAGPDGDFAKGDDNLYSFQK